MLEKPKTIEEVRAYRYNRWAGNPEGNAYRDGFCAEEVSTNDRSMQFYQCNRKNGHGPDGLFCAQHSPRSGRAPQGEAGGALEEAGGAQAQQGRLDRSPHGDGCRADGRVQEARDLVPRQAQEARRERRMNTYTVFWLGGESQLIQGRDIVDAFNRAGIGGGAVPALDFWGRGDIRDEYRWDAEKRCWIEIE